MRYITKEGIEANLESISDCAAAIRSGALTSDTLVHEPMSDRWVKASAHRDISSLLSAKSNAEKPASNRSRRVQVAAWSAWIVGLGLPPIIAALQGRDAAFVFGEALGAAIGWGVIGAIALIFVKSKGSRAVLALVLGLLLCISELPRLIQDEADRQRLHASATNLSNQLKASPVDSATTVTAAGNQSSPMGESVASERVDNARAASAVLDIASDIVRENNQRERKFKATMDSLKLDTILSPNTVRSESGLQDAQHRVDSWAALIDSYQQDYERAIANARSRFAAMPVADGERTANLAKFDAGVARSEPLARNFLSIERQSIAEVRALLSFITDRLGLIRVSDGKLIFPTSADADTYNAHMKRITQLADEEDKAVSALVRAQKEGNRKLQDLATSVEAH